LHNTACFSKNSTIVSGSNYIFNSIIRAILNTTTFLNGSKIASEQK